MDAVEFEGTIVAGAQIALPPEIAREIPAGTPVRIVVMWERPILTWLGGVRGAGGLKQRTLQRMPFTNV